ncbi:hypothetical protein B0H13DRAFT_1856829 [Mycena leptocephala]|nr:hypothetical protein B0H13DRAFT_1856829 [Mycena leptocephala]
MALSSIRVLLGILTLAVIAVAGGKSKAERLAACGPSTRIVGNSTIEANGQTLQFSVTFCGTKRSALVDARSSPEAKHQGEVETLENGIIHAERDSGEMATTERQPEINWRENAHPKSNVKGKLKRWKMEHYMPSGLMMKWLQNVNS